MPMVTLEPVRKRLTRIGSSTAVVLPKEMCDALGVHAGDYVDVTSDGERIVTRKASTAAIPATVASLDELFEGWVGPYEPPTDYPHVGDEINWGVPVGEELW